MKRLALGFIIGVAVGVVAPVTAAEIVGRSGFLVGWVVTQNGEEVCADPIAWPSLKEIDCAPTD